MGELLLIQISRRLIVWRHEVSPKRNQNSLNKGVIDPCIHRISLFHFFAGNLVWTDWSQDGFINESTRADSKFG